MLEKSDFIFPLLMSLIILHLQPPHIHKQLINPQWMAYYTLDFKVDNADAAFISNDDYSGLLKLKFIVGY